MSGMGVIGDKRNLKDVSTKVAQLSSNNLRLVQLFIWKKSRKTKIFIHSSQYLLEKSACLKIA